MHYAKSSKEIEVNTALLSERSKVNYKNLEITLNNIKIKNSAER